MRAQAEQPERVSEEERVRKEPESPAQPRTEVGGMTAPDLGRAPDAPPAAQPATKSEGAPTPRAPLPKKLLELLALYKWDCSTATPELPGAWRCLAARRPGETLDVIDEQHWEHRGGVLREQKRLAPLLTDHLAMELPEQAGGLPRWK